MQVPTFQVNIYKYVVGFLLGAAVVQLFTDTAKYSIGRLRPHFIDVCQPDWSKINCLVDDRPNFVTNFTCLGNDLLFPDEQERFDRIKDARLSFFSGHASCSFSAMIFVILYLQARISKGRSPFPSYFVPFMQTATFVFALFTSFSRVSDYKHHPGDVATGAIFGTFIQIVNVVWVLKLFSSNDAKVVSRSISSTETENPSLRLSGYGTATRVYNANSTSENETV